MFLGDPQNVHLVHVKGFHLLGKRIGKSVDEWVVVRAEIQGIEIVSNLCSY